MYTNLPLKYKESKPDHIGEVHNHWEYLHHLLCLIDCDILDLGPNLTKILPSFGDLMEWMGSLSIYKLMCVSMAGERIRHACFFDHI